MNNTIKKLVIALLSVWILQSTVNTIFKLKREYDKHIESQHEPSIFD